MKNSVIAALCVASIDKLKLASRSQIDVKANAVPDNVPSMTLVICHGSRALGTLTIKMPMNPINTANHPDPDRAVPKNIIPKSAV